MSWFNIRTFMRATVTTAYSHFPIMTACLMLAPRAAAAVALAAAAAITVATLILDQHAWLMQIVKR